MRQVVVAFTVASLLVLPVGPATATTDAAVGVDGSVFLDLDADGTRGLGEPGRGGVQLTLRTEATIVDATTTQPDGTWRFANVQPGTYDVLIEPPMDHVVTGGTLPGLDPGARMGTLEVDTRDLDAGSVGLGSPVDSGPDVATTVTHDPDGDGDLRWEAVVHNLGPDATAGPVELRLVLSAAHEAAQAGGAGWTCELSAAIVLCQHAEAVPTATSLPPVVLTTRPLGEVGASASVTGTVRLEGMFDAAPLNDEDTAAAPLDASGAVEDLDGDGTGDLTDAGAPATGLLVAGLIALVAGAATVRTSRVSRVSRTSRRTAHRP